ncbi:MAG TPA: hypothetical protein VF669_22650 [Tepidisphaeraceae bacterium]|jgi:hypothetical protein
MRLLTVLLALLFVASADAQVTKPATTQASEPLVGGALRYAAPAGWEVFGEKKDNFVRYRLGEDKAQMEIAVDVLPNAVGPAQAPQMALQVGKAVREQAKKENRQLLYGPRAEKDDRFWLKLHDRAKLTTGQTADRQQIFRIMGIYCVRVTATGVTDSEDEAKKIHTIGEDLLDQMKISRGVKPTYFPRTQLRITPPIDWKEQKIDKPNDLTAIYSVPSKLTCQIIIRARVLPKDARTDETKRNALLDKMIDEERQTAPYSKGDGSKQDEAKSDDKSLKIVTSTFSQSGKTLSVKTRYSVVADLLVSVRTVAEPQDEKEVTAAADSIKVAPLRD